MKKFLSIILTIMMLSTLLLANVVKADEYIDPFTHGIGDISLPQGSPVIDGVITKDEGWSAAQLIDKTNTDGAWGGEEVRVSNAFYRAWDKDGLYYAADISTQFLPQDRIESGCTDIILSTDRDDIDGDSVSNVCGWNGDVFMLALDPNDVLYNAGFLEEAPAWYCIGIFEGNVLRMYREQINQGEITDKVQLKGSLTDAGWRFEAFIPWDIIVKDTNDKLDDPALSITKDDIVKDGTKFTSAVLYQDRMIDGETGEPDTYSRYVTIAKTLRDGTDGTLCAGWYIKAYGMFMKMTEKTSTDLGEKDDVVTDQFGNDIAAGNASKTTAAQRTNASTSSGSAPQTLDTGICVFVVALVVSVFGIVCVKKKA